MSAHKRKSLTSEEVREEWRKLEACRKEQEEKENMHREWKNAMQEAVDKEYERVIRPVLLEQKAIEDKMRKLQGSCPKREDKDEHGEGKTCSICGEFTEVCTGVD